MNTMMIAPMTKALAFARASPLARSQPSAVFGVSTIRMLSAAAPGPKVSLHVFYCCLMYV